MADVTFDRTILTTKRDSYIKQTLGWAQLHTRSDVEAKTEMAGRASLSSQILRDHAEDPIILTDVQQVTCKTAASIMQSTSELQTKFDNGMDLVLSEAES